MSFPQRQMVGQGWIALVTQAMCVCAALAQASRPDGYGGILGSIGVPPVRNASHAHRRDADATPFGIQTSPVPPDAPGRVLLGDAPESVRRGWRNAARVHYWASLPAPQTQSLEVRIEASGVDGPHVDFVLPTWRPGRYVVLDFAGTVDRVAAFDEQERPLPLQKLDKTTWRVTTNGARTVNLKYRMYANELGLRTRHIDDSHAFLSGCSVLMYVEGRRLEPVQLTVEPPAGWRVSTGLDAAPDVEGDAAAHRVFVAPSYDVLIDAPLEIGTHAVHPFEIGDRKYELAIWGEAPYDAEKVVRDLKKLVTAHVDFWRDAPYGRYVFLLHLTSGAGGGTEHLNSTIMQTSRDAFTSGKPSRGLLGLISHEFFHTWNVKALRPAGLKPYDFTHENYTDLLWVAEGTTTYYGGLLLVRAGLTKPKDYLKNLADGIDGYRRRPGRLAQSLDESSFDAWTKFNKPSGDAGNTTISFYEKGSFVSLLLDLEIRQRTQNKSSFDDVLRTLYQRFPLDGPGYTRADLLSICNEIAGDDLGPFFAAYVAGTEELPFEKMLEYAGLRLVEKPNRDEEDEETKEDGPQADANATPGSQPASQPATQPEESAPDNPSKIDSVAPADTQPAMQPTTQPASSPASQPAAVWRANLGVSLTDADGLARVTAVAADGPAYAAGVQTDDLIVALNGRRLRANDLAGRLKLFQPGDAVTLTLLRRDLLKQISVTLAARKDAKLSIEQVDKPTELQKSIYEAWQGQPWKPGKSKKK